MQQPLIPPRADRSRYEYSIQPTEDQEELNEDVAGGKKPPAVKRSNKAPNYKPRPLTWPFITAMVVVLCIGIGLVVYAEKALPDSDSDAIIVDSLPAPTTRPRRLARADFNNSSAIVSASPSPSPSPSLAGIPSITSAPSSDALPTSSAEVVSVSSEVVDGADRVSKQDVLSGTSSESAKDLPQNPSISQSIPEPPSSKQPQISTVSESGGSIFVASDPSLEASGSSTPPESLSEDPGGRANRRPIPSGSSEIGGQENIGLPSSTSKDVATFPSNVVATATSVFKTTSFTTRPASTFTTIVNMTTVSTFTTVSEVTTFTEVSSDMTSVFESSVFFPSFSGNMTVPSGAVSTLTETRTIPTLGSSPVTVTVPVTSQTTVVVPSAVETTVQATVAPVVGEVTVTYFTTLTPNGPTNGPQTEGRRPEIPVEVTGTRVIDGTTIWIVETQTPVIVVVPTNNVKTVIEPGQVVTGVTRVGGAEVTSFLVLTPTPINRAITVNVASTVGGTPVTVVTQPDPTTFETLIGGVLRTVVETPPPQTLVQIAGGVLTTVGQVFTAAGPGQPITFTVVSDVNGTPVTQVVVSTPAAGNIAFEPITFSFTTSIGGTPTVITLTPPPTSFVTTIDGTSATMVTTPPVTSFTTTIGGTLTTQTSVTTPTGTALITVTFVSTRPDGRLTTFTSTLLPTTFVTTLSGSLLTTITSTPSPTTRLSTRSRSTTTFTSTSSAAPSAPTNTPPVVTSTRVFSWTESDIFLGTFLPPLLGVALVIALRVIDLNAKLYQPFQSLARASSTTTSGPGALGSETLTVQYTGFMTFVTPIITLLQGHPVPFLTTLMVLCGSFIVPLATEAIGLKLHGVCVQNTATPGCGPSLGVSPAPAHALMALMGVVIVLLVVVLVLIGRWGNTGVHANPWNLAGIASLVVGGGTGVRVRENGEREMRRTVARGRYAMGWAVNKATGKEEYGIVLADEDGRGLNDEMGGEGGDDPLRPNEGGVNDDDGLITGEGGALGVADGGKKRTNSANNLPLMPLRYPWRVALIAFQLGLLVFLIYYHVYYHATLNYKGRVFDDGRLWEFMNANTFGVRFVAAIVGVIIAFCWQSFFLSVSVMAPYQLMALRTQPAERSILFSSSTNAFSGIYAAFKKRHLFLLAVSLAAILSELLPVFLANVFFSLSQTSRTATACATISSIILGLLIGVLVCSFFVKWPPMPVDPRSIAGMLYYVSQSHMLDSGDFDGVSTMDHKERDRRVRERGRRYFYGVLVGGTWQRLGVDCDLAMGSGGDLGMVDTAYRGAGVPGGLGLAEGGKSTADGMGGGAGDMSGGAGGGSGSGSGSDGAAGRSSGSTHQRGGSAGGISGVSALSRIDEPPALHEHDEGLLASGKNGFGPSFASRMGIGGRGYDTIGPGPSNVWR